MELYQNKTPNHLRKYRVSVKKISGNIYFVNVDDLNDFYMFNGNPDHLDRSRIYDYNDLLITGGYAKVNNGSYAIKRFGARR